MKKQWVTVILILLMLCLPITALAGGPNGIKGDIDPWGGDYRIVVMEIIFATNPML